MLGSPTNRQEQVGGEGMVSSNATEDLLDVVIARDQVVREVVLGAIVVEESVENVSDNGQLWWVLLFVDRFRTGFGGESSRSIDGFQNRIKQPLGKPSNDLQVRRSLGVALGDFDNQIIPHDRPGRPIGPGSFPFSPVVQFANNREPTAIEVSEPTKLPPLLQRNQDVILVERRHALQTLELFVRPTESTSFVQFGREPFPHRQQIANVIVSIPDLLRREWSIAPFGKRLGFGEFDAKDLVDEIRVAQGIRVAQEPSSNLEIEQVARCRTSPQIAKSYFFSCRVDDDEMVRVRDQVPKCVECPHRLRIDQEQLRVRCDLNQTQFWMVTVFPDEFRIEPKTPRRGQVFAAAFELLRSRNEFFRSLIPGLHGWDHISSGSSSHNLPIVVLFECQNQTDSGCH